MMWTYNINKNEEQVVADELSVEEEHADCLVEKER
jgi:hypothetical protein